MVKGKENMTLESIYKISDVLGVQLISFPDYEDTFNVIETKKNILFENNYSHPEVKEKLILPNMSSENSSINIIFSQYDNLQMTKKYIEGIDVLPYYPTQELLS
jgi:SpoU rRNA methylase family enzyme